IAVERRVIATSPPKLRWRRRRRRDPAEAIIYRSSSCNSGLYAGNTRVNAAVTLPGQPLEHQILRPKGTARTEDLFADCRELLWHWLLVSERSCCDASSYSLSVWLITRQDSFRGPFELLSSVGIGLYRSISLDDDLLLNVRIFQHTEVFG